MYVATLRKSHLFGAEQNPSHPAISPTYRNKWNMGKTSHKPTPDLPWAQVPEQSSVFPTLGSAEEGLQKKKNIFYCLFAMPMPGPSRFVSDEECALGPVPLRAAKPGKDCSPLKAAPKPKCSIIL